MKDKQHFVAISGSLRKGSYNTMILHAAQKLAPENIVIGQLVSDDVPMYNFDLHEKAFPDVVIKLYEAVKKADCSNFCTA